MDTRILKITVISLLLMGTLSACSNQQVQADSIQQAYAMPDVVSMPPYTRTIFSTHNF